MSPSGSKPLPGALTGKDEIMKSLISRTTAAALIAASFGAGVVVLTPVAAMAQMSPSNPNYTYDSRNGTGIYVANDGASAFAQAPVAHRHINSGIGAYDSVATDGSMIGQDPDPNVRLQMRRDGDALFDR
jgi:hypothetical protein